MKLFQKNEPLSAITHLIAMLLSIAGLVIMIIFAANNGSAAHVIGFTIFGASLILLYSSSCLYHFLPRGTKIKNVFKRLDHAMIFVLIAGTYTPICLTFPKRGLGWSLFGVIWGLVMAGIALKIVNIKMKRWMPSIIYLIMGWIAIYPMAQWLAVNAFNWLLIGGILYTAGCLFYALDKFVRRTKWIGMHEIFHIFVMAGSFSHFWLMLKYILHS